VTLKVFVTGLLIVPSGLAPHRLIEQAAFSIKTREKRGEFQAVRQTGPGAFPDFCLTVRSKV
jgi:hypothetical protein